jgi:hypothetical protein
MRFPGFMLSDFQVQKSLEDITDSLITASPNKTTVSTPDFWILTLKPNGIENEGIHLGTLHNEGHWCPDKPYGVSDSPYAILKKYVPEEKDMFIGQLNELTSGNVYFND